MEQPVLCLLGLYCAVVLLFVSIVPSRNLNGNLNKERRINRYRIGVGLCYNIFRCMGSEGPAVSPHDEWASKGQRMILESIDIIQLIN